MAKKRFLLLVSLILILNLVYASDYELRGSFCGKVVTSTNDPIPSVKVHATWNENEMNQNYTITTNFSGDFCFLNLTYINNTVKISSLGLNRTAEAYSADIKNFTIIVIPFLTVKEKETGVFEKIEEFVNSIITSISSGNRTIKIDNKENKKTRNSNDVIIILSDEKINLSYSEVQAINKEIDTNDKIILENGLKSEFVNNTTNKSYEDDDIRSHYWRYIILIISILAAFFIFFFVNDKNRKNRLGNIAYKKIKSIGLKKVRSFMKKDVETLNETDSLLDAFEIFSRVNGASIIPITKDGKVLGFVNKRVLAEIKNTDFDYIHKTKLKGTYFMNKTLLCHEDTLLDQMLFIMDKNKTETLCIVDDKNKLLGTVDYFDVLKLFYNAFSKKPTSSLSKIKFNLQKFLTIDSGSSLYDLKKNLIKNNKAFCLVKENEKIIGIVTLKEILMAIHNGTNLHKTSVKNITSQNIFTLNSDSLDITSLKEILDKRYNQVPIKKYFVFKGIIGIKEMINQLYDEL